MVAQIAGELQVRRAVRFTTSHGISPVEARKLIDRVGNDRENLDAAAANRGKEGASS